MRDNATRHTILFLDHASANGGAEQSLLLLLEQLNRNRWSPHLVCADGALADSAEAIDVPVHRVPFRRLRRSPRFALDWFSTTMGLAELARSIDAAILHANTVRAAMYAAPAARSAHLPFIWHMRDFWVSESRPRLQVPDRLVKRVLCTTASAVITNSHAVAGRLPCLDRTIVIHNGIDTGQFDPPIPGTDFRSAHSIPLDAPLVGMVGRLRPWKGQERFLHMAAVVAADRPDVHFVIVGGDPFQITDGYTERLIRLVQDLGLAERTTLTGHIDDVRPALAAMDVFVHPGDPEPFGLVNIEAMAMAKPVVAFAHGALPEIVDNGMTGMLVAPYDMPELARRVQILLNEPGYANVLGKQGRRLALQRFDVTIAAQQIQDIYERLV